LSDGASLEGVEVALLGGASAKTDASGIARVPFGEKPSGIVVGRKGNDVVLLPEGRYNSTYRRSPELDTVRWLVFDDRGIYKPGEEVRMKGWLRRSGQGRGGDIDAIPAIRDKVVRYKAVDPRGGEIGHGQTMADEHGAFDFAFKLPGNANLGTAYVELDL